MSFILPSWKNDEGQLENNGRCNLGVVTLNVPRIAIEADGDMQQFWDIFEKRMQLLHDALVYRIERLQDAIPDNAPILYKSGAFKINSLQKILSNHYLQINALQFQWGISVYTKQQHYFMDRIGNIILRLKHSH